MPLSSFSSFTVRRSLAMSNANSKSQRALERQYAVLSKRYHQLLYLKQPIPTELRTRLRKLRRFLGYATD